MKDELSYELPNCVTLVEGEPVVLREKGAKGVPAVSLYCDGDIELSLPELNKIILLLHRFVYERERLSAG